MSKPRPTRHVIDFSAYPIKAFLDANIALQGRALAELPWEDVDSQGPILALLTPQAVQEIDSKKRDGRLGPHARAFSQILGPIAVSGVPLLVREAGPRVELGLVLSEKVPWEDYDALDPDDGDSRIVAEALHAKGVEPDQKVLISHDNKPVTLASMLGLEVLRVSDAWLRPDEPGPKDKEITRLKQRLRELEANAPVFELEILRAEADWGSLITVAPLTSDERYILNERVVDANPEPANGTYMGAGMAFGADRGFDRRWTAYSETVLPNFVDSYAAKMEMAFNQRLVTVVVRNVGSIQAEGIVIEISASEGWVHDKVVGVAPSGPDGPTPRDDLIFRPRIFSDIRPLRVGRHEFEFTAEPRRERTVTATCEDLRHGAEWRFDGVVLLDPHKSEPFELRVRVTAGNLRGDITQVFTVPKVVTAKTVSSLVDIEELKYHELPPLLASLLEAKAGDRVEMDSPDDDD